MQHHQRRLSYLRGRHQRIITAGKLADYVVFADDMHTVDPDKIKDVKIVQTVVGGTARYQA